MTEPSLAKEASPRKLSKATLFALAATEKWFSNMHDVMYREHEKAAKAGDGLFCKIFESGMGAHDRAWIRYGCLLQDLGIPIEESRAWRKMTEGSVEAKPQ